MLSYSPFFGDGKLMKAGRALPRASELATMWNPGNLRFYVRDRGRRRHLPLVVILHGCGQKVETYARDTGWFDLASRDLFALLLVEQQAINNADRCFNWFNPLHIQRHLGEAASIAAAIHQLVEAGAVDPERVFVTGLSAGGAMASVMLATYPELFAGGAIIAGVPYGCANWVTSPRECMSGAARIPSSDLAGYVLRASPHKGPWPRISVWHGSEDSRVVPSNGTDIVRQWLSVHGLRARPHLVELADGHPHRVWFDKAGAPAVEQYDIQGLGHGTPVGGKGQIGRPGHNVLEASISSTARIAEFFGLGSGKRRLKAA